MNHVGFNNLAQLKPSLRHNSPFLEAPEAPSAATGETRLVPH